MLVCQKSLCLMQVALSRAAALLDTPSQPLRDQEGGIVFEISVTLPPCEASCLSLPASLTSLSSFCHFPPSISHYIPAFLVSFPLSIPPFLFNPASFPPFFLPSLFSSLSSLPLDPDEAFLLQYCDSVLKLLPDIKTLVNLRQQLATGGRNGRWNEDGEFLTSEERIRSAGKHFRRGISNARSYTICDWI